MDVSKLSMVSFAMSITPIIIDVARPLINQFINLNTFGAKIIFVLLIYPLLSVNSIILAVLSSSYMKNYNLKGQAIASSAIILGTLTFLYAVFKITLFYF